MNLELIAYRAVWYIRGDVDVTLLHPSDKLFEGRLVNKRTRDKILKFAKDHKAPIEDIYVPILDARVKSYKNNVGVSTGSIWRTYPNCKVNSMFDNLFPSELGPDLKQRMELFFRKEKIRVDSYVEKYQELCKNVYEKGGSMPMPDPELHNYMNSFPDNLEDFITEKSKCIIDQLYVALRHAKAGKCGILQGYIPDFAMKERIDPDINLIFNRKIIEEDLMFSTMLKKDDSLYFDNVLNKANSRIKEIEVLQKYISLVLAWGLECTYAVNPNLNTTLKVDDYISTDMDRTIDNIFRIAVSDINTDKEI